MKQNKGITMVALVLTVIILLILAGISIGTGNKTIKQSELENIKTNMLLIKVKAKEIAENATHNLGTLFSSITDENEKAQRLQQTKNQLIGEIIDNINEFNILTEQENNELEFFGKLSTENLDDMGLTNVKSDKRNGWYIVKYDLKNIQVEIYHTKGFKVEDKTYYSLTEIQDLDI